MADGSGGADRGCARGANAQPHTSRHGFVASFASTRPRCSRASPGRIAPAARSSRSRSSRSPRASPSRTPSPRPTRAAGPATSATPTTPSRMVRPSAPPIRHPHRPSAPPAARPPSSPRRSKTTGRRHPRQQIRTRIETFLATSSDLFPSSRTLTRHPPPPLAVGAHVTSGSPCPPPPSGICLSLPYRADVVAPAPDASRRDCRGSFVYRAACGCVRAGDAAKSVLAFFGGSTRREGRVIGARPRDLTTASRLAADVPTHAPSADVELDHSLAMVCRVRDEKTCATVYDLQREYDDAHVEMTSASLAAEAAFDAYEAAKATCEDAARKVADVDARRSRRRRGVPRTRRRGGGDHPRGHAQGRARASRGFAGRGWREVRSRRFVRNRRRAPRGGRGRIRVARAREGGPRRSSPRGRHARHRRRRRQLEFDRPVHWVRHAGGVFPRRAAG